MFNGFADLVDRHRVDPGRLVHVGSTVGLGPKDAVTAYYEAGYTDITVVDSDPRRIKALRTRFPGVDVVEVRSDRVFRLDATAPDAHTAVVNMSGHELAVLQFAPWSSLRLLTVCTTAADNATGPSSYDLVTETVTTRGFVEVGTWPRLGSGSDIDVAFIRN